MTDTAPPPDRQRRDSVDRGKEIIDPAAAILSEKGCEAANETAVPLIVSRPSSTGTSPITLATLPR